MTELATARASASLGPGDAIPDDFVVPYYLEDLKRRISVARIDERLYAFDDLCTCAERPCPLSGGLLTGYDAHVPMPRLPVRRRHGRRAHGPATEPLNVYEVQEVDGCVQIRA